MLCGIRQGAIGEEVTRSGGGMVFNASAFDARVWPHTFKRHILSAMHAGAAHWTSQAESFFDGPTDLRYITETTIFRLSTPSGVVSRRS